MDPRTVQVLSGLAARDRVITTRDAERAGVSGDELRAACARGDLVRVRVDAYTTADRWQGLEDAERHRLRVIAAARRLHRPVFTHDSAAALWRLPRIGRWPESVHVSLPHGVGNRSSAGVRRHATPGPVGHVATVEGVRVTGVARTVVDVARTWELAAAVAAADHALHRGWTTPARLATELEAAGAGRGVRRARRVVEAASGLSESVGESLSRARMIELGLPLPELQHVVEDDAGVVGRVDFWWPELGLVGEFDGRLKYRAGGVPDGRQPEDRVWAEKRREDRLRALGLQVVRWTWDTALSPDALGAVLAASGVHPRA